MLMLISRWVDQMGNVHGRVEGMNANAAALLIGSHLVMLNLFSLFFIKKKKSAVIVILHAKAYTPREHAEDIVHQC
jgi:hypothetical protein